MAADFNAFILLMPGRGFWRIAVKRIPLERSCVALLKWTTSGVAGILEEVAD
jgi:hypothetical protein